MRNSVIFSTFIISTDAKNKCIRFAGSRQPLFYESKFENFEESEEHPEEFNKIPGSTLGIHAPVSVSESFIFPLTTAVDIVLLPNFWLATVSVAFVAVENSL